MLFFSNYTNISVVMIYGYQIATRSGSETSLLMNQTFSLQENRTTCFEMLLTRSLNMTDGCVCVPDVIVSRAFLCVCVYMSIPHVCVLRI